MAHKTCPACRNALHPLATKCGHCLTVFNDDEIMRGVQEAQSRQRGQVSGWLLAAVGLLIVLINVLNNYDLPALSAALG